MKEQIDKGDRNRSGKTKSWRYWYKRYHARLMRREAKRKLEDAPKSNRAFNGWSL